ncbi:MAG: fibronectin type III domain-containing protein [Deltaproteobacteria bacterium]|nr:fibronectin type III domain-containing protein [Deltaproteobacteria bacterium]
MRTRMCITVLVAAALLAPAGADGATEVPGFTINSIDGVGSLEGQLPDRLEDDYRVSYEDCLLYLEGYVAENPDADPVERGEDTAPAADDVVEDAAEQRKPSPGKYDDAGELTPRILIRWSVSSTLAGYDFAVKVGSCSDTGGIGDEETDTCRYVVTRKELDGYTNNELFVELPDLLGDECDEGDSGEAAIYFFFQSGDFTDSRRVETVQFEWDYEAPAAPTGLEISEGENNLKVSWSDEANSDDVTYDIYWSPESFTGADLGLEGVESRKELTAKSFTIPNLGIGVEYHVGVVAVDEFGNESVLSSLATGTPVNVADFWEQYKAAGGNDPGGFCFVATAAWGSPMEPHVATLRAFRDRVLLRSAFGRGLVDAYYTDGPVLARVVEGSPALRALARLVLWPLVGVAWLSLTLGPAALLVVLLSLAGAATGLWRWRRNRNSRRAAA